MKIREMKGKAEHFRAKKAQIMTFDFSSSFIIFIIFLVIFIGLFVFSISAEKKSDFELEYVFANFENNLRFSPDPGIDFFSDYRIDKAKLENFASAIGAGSIDDYVIGNVSGAHGIGLDPSGYSSCLYFTDNNRSRISINGMSSWGYLTKAGTSCDEEFGNNRDPCDRYGQALAIFKPVLLDERDVHSNRIIQMNLVICKK